MPAVPEELLDLAAQVRDHYLTNLGAALALVLPPGGSLRLRRVAEPTAAGLEALAAGHKAAAGLERYVGGATPDAARRVAASPRLADRRATGYTSRANGRRRVGSASARASRRRLGARQRAALDYMRRRRTVNESDLRKHTGLSAHGLARLLDDDLVRPAGDGASACRPGRSGAHAAARARGGPCGRSSPRPGAASRSCSTA